MTVKLRLKPEVETGLLAQARARAPIGRSRARASGTEPHRRAQKRLLRKERRLVTDDAIMRVDSDTHFTVTRTMRNPRQAVLFPETENGLLEIEPGSGSSSTFIDNMRQPVHRWFRYSAGFSAQWVESVVRTEKPEAVLDPFAGSGTTLLAAQSSGISSVGVEAHPFVVRIANAKLNCRTDIREFLERARATRASAQQLRGTPDDYPPLMRKCFDDEALRSLDSLRRAWLAFADGSAASELVWLVLVSILRQVSHAGTAPWQYVLPRKRKRSPLGAFQAFDVMVQMVAADMRAVQAQPAGPLPNLLQGDARTCDGVSDHSIDVVITSPPYPNNYDYADATRLEMSFMGEVAGWGDLHDAVRRHLITSCAQHWSERTLNLDSVLARPELQPIRCEINPVCERLGIVRLERGGRKNYHLMVASYFADIARVWLALRRVCRSDSRVCFVIGDSAPYGVYVPVIEWMSALAQAAGFRSTTFERTRDRNTKWKNRKHRVPLCEGRLWVNG